MALQIKPICFENNFSEKLNAIADEKWNAFAASCREKNIDYILNHEVGGVLKRIFVFSDFLYKNCTRNPEILKLIDGEVSKVNKNLSRVETIKKFALMPRQFYEEDGDVTPTKKVKRRFLEKRYADMIESLYQG